jgi:hypothetical protein
MARIRTVKPRLFTSATLARVSIPARFLFVGLLTEADDEGRLLDSPKKIAGDLFPHDEHVSPKKVAGWLDELEGAGCVTRYSADQVSYLYLPHFADHQRISHPTPSILPNPSGDIPESLRPEVEQGTGNREVEEEQGKSKAGEPVTNGKSKLARTLDSLNLGLVESLWSRHPGWDREVSFAYLQALTTGSQKRHIPAFGAKAVNVAIDALYENDATVSDPAAYLRQVCESA